MIRYIPDDLFIKIENKKRVVEILHSVPDTCMRFPDEKTPEDAVKEIRALGENKVADFFAAGC